MYTLHIGNKNYSSWSLRPWVLLRALDIPFTEVMHIFSDCGNFEEFRTFSPTGKVPCLVDSGTCVWDSLAITEYVAEAHARVWPQDKSARAWARSASAEMHSGFSALRNECSMSCGQRVTLRQPSEQLLADITRIDELWCEGLQSFGGPFLAADQFTAVDAFFAPVIFRIETYNLQLSAKAQAYKAAMIALPAMREWYDAALAETYREASHESDIANSGTIQADYRAR